VVSSGFPSSFSIVIFSPLDFASISFSSSFAYASEYWPRSNSSVVRFSTNVFPSIHPRLASQSRVSLLLHISLDYMLYI
jgi:hypothetical protein